MHPCEESGDLLGGLAFRLILLGGLAGRQGVSVGAALVDRHGRDREAMLPDRLDGVLKQAGRPRRRGVDDDIGGPCYDLHDPGCRSNGAQIEDGGAAGDQDQVGDLGGGDRVTGRMGRAVDNREPGARVSGDVEGLTEGRWTGLR